MSRNKSFAKFTLEWDAATEAGAYYDQKVLNTTGIPRVFCPRYRKVFIDDFDGVALDTNRWNVVDTSAAGTPTNSILDAANGQLRLLLDNTSEAQTYGINKNDLLMVHPASEPVLEFGFTTSLDIAANEVVVCGLGSTHNNTFDSIASNAWFRLDGDADILVETDDGTTNDDDNDTTLNMLANSIHHAQINVLSPGNVKFRINNTKCLDSTTFAINSSTMLQPMFIVQKASGTTTPALILDYVALFIKA